MLKIILASKSKVRKEILNNNGIQCSVIPSNINEEIIKDSLIKENTTPAVISKNLAELKANKVSLNQPDEIVIGADSVIDLDGKIISKPSDRETALHILKKLNNKTHYLISSVCISRNGKMVWNYSDKARLKMKNFSVEDLIKYLNKITDKNLYAYNVYQIEGEGKFLFSHIDGDKDTIMGLPVRQIKEYLNGLDN
ncbi:Maf family protein [Candidatus Pelagibacter sp.]|nr:Maf family protein [Candidatus Pelagibacter sp.]